MLEELKRLLGLDLEDTDQDKKLSWIIESSKSRLKLLLGGIEPPTEMNSIIVDVSVIRYNRIGSEGMSVNSVEGENQHYHDSDFKGYSREIQAYLDTLNAVDKKGGFKFL